MVRSDFADGIKRKSLYDLCFVLLVLFALLFFLSACGEKYADLKPDVPANKDVSVSADESDLPGLFSGEQGEFVFGLRLNKKGEVFEEESKVDDDSKKIDKKEFDNIKSQEVSLDENV